VKVPNHLQIKPEREGTRLSGADLLVVTPWLFFGAGLAAIGYGLLRRRRAARRRGPGRRSPRQRDGRR
jgi:hypothetical protein